MSKVILYFYVVCAPTNKGISLSTQSYEKYKKLWLLFKNCEPKNYEFGIKIMEL